MRTNLLTLEQWKAIAEEQGYRVYSAHLSIDPSTEHWFVEDSRGNMKGTYCNDESPVWKAWLE